MTNSDDPKYDDFQNSEEELELEIDQDQLDIDFLSQDLEPVADVEMTADPLELELPDESLLGENTSPFADELDIFADLENHDTGELLEADQIPDFALEEIEDRELAEESADAIADLDVVTADDVEPLDVFADLESESLEKGIVDDEFSFEDLLESAETDEEQATQQFDDAFLAAAEVAVVPVVEDKKTKKARLKAEQVAAKAKAKEDKAAKNAKALEAKTAAKAQAIENKAAAKAQAKEVKAAKIAKALEAKAAAKAKAIEAKAAKLAAKKGKPSVTEIPTIAEVPTIIDDLDVATTEPVDEHFDTFADLESALPEVRMHEAPEDHEDSFDDILDSAETDMESEDNEGFFDDLLISAEADEEPVEQQLPDAPLDDESLAVAEEIVPVVEDKKAKKAREKAEQAATAAKAKADKAAAKAAKSGKPPKAVKEKPVKTEKPPKAKKEKKPKEPRDKEPQSVAALSFMGSLVLMLLVFGGVNAYAVMKLGIGGAMFFLAFFDIMAAIALAIPIMLRRSKDSVTASEVSLGIAAISLVFGCMFVLVNLFGL